MFFKKNSLFLLFQVSVEQYDKKAFPSCVDNIYEGRSTVRFDSLNPDDVYKVCKFNCVHMFNISFHRFTIYIANQWKHS